MLISQKDKNAAPVLFCRGCAGIQLQRFVGNQLAHRDALLIEAIGMPVTYLERRAEGQLTLDGVPRGHFRVLSQAERHLLSSGGETLSFGHFL